jgi:hypothetical protein
MQFTGVRSLKLILLFSSKIHQADAKNIFIGTKWSSDNMVPCDLQQYEQGLPVIEKINQNILRTN